MIADLILRPLFLFLLFLVLFYCCKYQKCYIYAANTGLLLMENTLYFITVTYGLTGITGNIILTMIGNSINDGCSQASVTVSLPFTTSHSTAFSTQDFCGSSTVDSNGAAYSSIYGLVAISTCSSLSQFGVFVSSAIVRSQTRLRSLMSGQGYLYSNAIRTYFIAVSSMSASFLEIVPTDSKIIK